MMELEGQIDLLFKNLLQGLIDTADPTDAISITINHQTFQYPLYIFGFRDNFNIEKVQTALLMLTQSKSRWVDLESALLWCNVKVFKNVRGEGSRIRNHANTSPGVVEVKNNGTSCGYFAFTIGFLEILSQKCKHVFGKRIKTTNRTGRFQ